MEHKEERIIKFIKFLDYFTQFLNNGQFSESHLTVEKHGLL